MESAGCSRVNPTCTTETCQRLCPARRLVLAHLAYLGALVDFDQPEVRSRRLTH
jgi:hypothetical protein